MSTALRSFPFFQRYPFSPAAFLCVGVGLAATLLLAPPFTVVCRAADASAAVTAARSPEEKAAESSALPVRAVTLFSSGVGYTLREGEVDGSATVPLTFRTGQINDILKSLVLLDENGNVRPVVYAAKDPIGRTLQSFAVDVSQPMSREELLNKMRGASVVAVLNSNQTLEGKIVGVETVNTILAPNGPSMPEYVLTLLGGPSVGMQVVNLNDVKAIRIEDERLNREFNEALSLLAGASDDKRRQVTLQFDGKGKRSVRVGYVSEAPLWKVSYRLLIGGADAKEGAKPYLQGWALVENTTDEDWNDIQLSLVSGRPISFIQDLYQPLYLPRPVVPPDVVASPYPQVAETDIDRPPPHVDTASAVTPPAPMVAETVGGAGPVYDAARAPARLRGGRALGGFGGGVGGFADGRAEAKVTEHESVTGEMAAATTSPSVAADATGEKAGELFAYHITTPVTLPRQQAAMIPILAQNVSGDKVSLYNADTDARFPLNAFRLKNDTGLHLKGGPVTLFDNGIYAGDARMEDVPPGDERLITYAVDLSVEGERQEPVSTGVQTTLSLKRGVLTITRRSRTTTNYSFRNKADKTRMVLVEHPFDPNIKLIEPTKPESRTAAHYRFAVAVPPGKTAKLAVVTEQPISETVGLLDADFDDLEVYTKRGDVPEKVKQALRDVLERRRHVQDLQGQASAADNDVAAIDKDEERIRKNMGALDHGSALYKRYVSQLDAQETRIEALRAEATRLRHAAADADRELRAYLDTLQIDG